LGILEGVLYEGTIVKSSVFFLILFIIPLKCLTSFTFLKNFRQQKLESADKEIKEPRAPMSNHNSQAICPILPKPIPLLAEGKPLGFIDPKPLLSERALSPDKIVQGTQVPNIPVYLDHFYYACAYPVQLFDRSSPQKFTEKILDKKFPQLPPHFGIPTQLKVKEEGRPLSGVFYDKGMDRFYAQALQVKRGHWYLVGDYKNYQAFLTGIYQFADRLYESSSLYSLIDWKLEGAPPTPPPFPEEADRQIKKFLTWLKDFDPELFQEVRTRIGYAERMPAEDSPWCEDPIKTTSGAFYDSETDRIVLMPEAILLLEEGKYDQVAPLLAHERAHRKSFINGLVVPSEQMLAHSLDSFLGRVAQKGFFGRAWVYFFGEATYRGASCRLLPLRPEEEIHAYHSQFRYAREKDLEKKNPDSFKDILNYASELWEILDYHFPPAWSFLASQYYYLAKSL
jgi:hypothetical protein